MTLHAMFPLSSFSIPVKKNNNNSYGSAKSCTRKVVSLCPHQANIFNISWLLASCLGSILSLSLMWLLIFVSEEVTILEWWYHLLWETNSVLQFWFQHYVSQNNIARISIAICIPATLRFSHYRVTNFQWVLLYISLQWKARWWCISVQASTLWNYSFMAVHLSLIRLAKAVRHPTSLVCLVLGALNASRARH